MKFQPQTQQTAREALITIDSFRKGYVNLIDEARMTPDMAKESNNMMQVSDGLWKTRWGTQYFGATYDLNPDGASEFVKSDATTDSL
jgi:hypothetical protein